MSQLAAPTLKETFELIFPDAEVDTLVQDLDFLAAEPSKVTAFHGFSTFKGIKIESKGFDVEGTIKGTIKTHDFKKLYEVYNLPSSSNWSLWAIKFKSDKSQSELRQTFQEEEKLDLAIDMKFRAPAAALGGVTFLRVGYETIRLRLSGVEKDFTVANPSSGSGRDEDGNEIPVEFEEI